MTARLVDSYCKFCHTPIVYRAGDVNAECDYYCARWRLLP